MPSLIGRQGQKDSEICYWFKSDLVIFTEWGNLARSDLHAH